MRRLNPPSITTIDSFNACRSKIRNKDLAQRLMNAQPLILSASKAFTEAAYNHQMHTLLPVNNFLSNITQREMAKLYQDRMVKKTSPGRVVYDEIFQLAPNQRCPLCMQRTVSSLDHYLPKAHYPELAVTPNNLVPVCTDCNHAKSDKLASTAEEVPLHPYYDDLGEDVWLIANVIEKRPAALQFSIKRPSTWDDILYARVKKHFRLFGLAGLYASQAAEELSNIRYGLKIIYSAQSDNGVRKRLEECAESRAAERINSWQTTAYRTWSKSVWFCKEGFL